ncbi:aminopeptidase P family protein [Sphingomonas sanguinis]|jgi:Xaa-Pro aminopeptidase|uniref:Aminopeptidase P family protein n=1 Tax=Sphingomonas sanguinis TaxID=33051 RepID=A0A7Y7QX13_9SPHN|nr:aminopeptidase P family protein [Sphingomonas sanguinis]MBZ6382625.1 aminopeptidase P family protein [Sphingomonas sanguinis]NNG50134.1 aminopeptidase P family protein [Sphingomonas sanguinis]NNG54510.1 aminopeptidase P family protein [Sphingomonas sanguinis]NVP31924.1 aminopeptidase P family protein [Sphingomonas sanguinis]
MSHSARLAALRAELAAQGLDGFVVPLTDEHMSEYVGDYAQRLGWLTGFGGSAGSAVVLRDKAAIFTDGRYTLQVREQVSGEDYAYIPVPQDSVAAWLGRETAAGQRIGYDPWLHTRQQVADMSAALTDRDAELVAVTANPIDAVWTDRPAPSPAVLTVQDDAVAGESSAAKRARIGEWLAEQRADAVVLSALDSIAWALNVRGTDVAHTPVALSYAIVHADGETDLFVAPEKITPAVRAHLGNAVRLHERSAFEGYLGGFAGQRVVADPERAVAAIAQALEAGGAKVLGLRDPVVLTKAIKNPAEVAGHRAASIRDGAAMVRFLRWVESECPKGGQTELSAAARLLACREATGLLKDTSFATISATGAHGASPHYHVTEESNAAIELGQLFLIDSGGQYQDGTTDITRVMPIGTPTDEMRDRFTRVLKGHIGLATAVFPDGTLGGHLDSLARRPLWEVGLDYAHGTGHGVGAYLSVHEGPQRIAAPNYPGGAAMEPLRAGMMLSNEPGYYKAGEYGIRIENLVLVEPREIVGADRDMLGFETLTLCPIERSLIVAELLTAAERDWLNAYHARVAEVLAPELEGADRDWLLEKCAAI